MQKHVEMENEYPYKTIKIIINKIIAIILIIKINKGDKKWHYQAWT